MEETQLSVAVWRPAEQWQAEDKAVELRMKVHMQRGRQTLVALVAMVLLTVATAAYPVQVRAVTVMFALNAVRLVVVYVRHRMLVGSWLPAAKDLLMGNPSRRVAARVVARQGGSVVVAVEQTYLRIRPATWGIRQVIARTGEITVIGPDPNGRAVVFVDSQPTPLPAQVVPTLEPTEPEPIARISANGAEDEVPTWLAVRHARAQWIQVGVVLVVMAAFAYDAQHPITYRQVVFPGTYNWFIVALLAVALLASLAQIITQSRLPKLLAAGQWHAYPVSIGTWKGDPKPVGDLTLRLSVPDGLPLSMRVKQAPVELVANVTATGTLWVIGTPEAGKVAAVGFPGYPVVAVARFV